MQCNAVTKGLIKKVNYPAIYLSVLPKLQFSSTKLGLVMVLVFIPCDIK